MNVYFGGTLYQHLETHTVHSPQIYGNFLSHGATAVPGSDCHAVYGTHFSINSHHHQGIKALAPGFTVTMRGDDGVIEAIAHDILPVWAVQWHPENMCLRFARPDTVDGLPILKRFVDSLK